VTMIIENTRNPSWHKGKCATAVCVCVCEGP